MQAHRGWNRQVLHVGFLPQRGALERHSVDLHPEGTRHRGRRARIAQVLAAIGEQHDAPMPRSRKRANGHLDGAADICARTLDVSRELA